MSGLETLKICKAYRIGSRNIKDFPITPELIKAKPVYQEMSGWKEDITGVRKYVRLPEAARKYIERIEQLVDRPIKYVSVGPHREAMIVR